MSERQLLFIPGPVTVAEPVTAAMSKPLIDHRGPEFKRILENITTALKPIFGTRNEILVVSASGTGGLEAAVGNVFGPGEKLLAAPIGVFGNRIVAIARAFGCEVETLETEWGRGVDPAALAARLRADGNHEIRGILLTHNETSTGVQNDMAALAAAIGSHPALVVVDSVSGMGATPFSMDDWNFDVVVAAPQKALAGPPGLAMLAVSDRAWQKMETNKTQRFYFDLKKAREFAALGQTPWTPPVSIFFALEVALDLYAREGAAQVHARHAAYAQALRNGAEAMGLRVFSRAPNHSVTVAALHVPEGIDPASTIRTAREGGYVFSGGQMQLKGKIFRIGTMGDISRDDLLGAIDALESALAAQGFKLERGAGVKAAGEMLDPVAL